ncbi:MAG: hypothetical protein Q3965_02950 [Rothia sp. (in: high G+C Gram-positive bacteria)]|nr:hypothetical protein [Rothia sp. (in: high G+C Gram-positive bacteria)]
MAEGDVELYMRGDYTPPLWAYGFIRADLSSVVDAWVGWYRSLGYFVECEPVQGVFPEVVGVLNPLRRISHSKVLFVPSADGQWVGTFTNRLPIPDRNATDYVGSALGADRVWVDDVPRGTGELSPKIAENRQFIYKYYSEPGQQKPHYRYVGAVNMSPGWHFENQGEPLWFENVEAYSERLVRRRLTSEMVRSYLRCLGVDVWGEGYFAGGGVLMSFVNPREHI